MEIQRKFRRHRPGFPQSRGYSKWGVLPRLSIYVLALFPVVPAFSFCSAPLNDETDISVVDSGGGSQEDAQIRVVFPAAAKRLELFLYDDTPVRNLVWHLAYDKESESGFDWPGARGGTVCVTVPSVPDSDGSIVAVANCPGAIREESVHSMDSIELLQMSYAEEDGDFPAMGGISGNGTVYLSTLFSEVDLVCVSHDLGGDVMMEEPVFRLERVNSGAELFRQDGFRPIQTLDSYKGLKSPSLMYSRLPCDIGRRALYPDIHLFCYPNDSPVATEGTPRTVAVLECIIKGQAVQFKKELPVLYRGCTVRLELQVDESGNGEWIDY